MNLKFILPFLILIVGISCKQKYTPKPRSYYRIDFPIKQYQVYNAQKAFLFEYPIYGEIEIYNRDSCWININFPRFNSQIHLTYKDIMGNVVTYFEDSRELAYKHTIKADAINEKLFLDYENNVYGIMYDIRGDAASSVQFYLTDSTKHFIRGALYFNCTPNKDSLFPLVQFIRQDIVHLIETFRWKN